MSTWGEFATAMLSALGAPESQSNHDALLGWFLGEQPPDAPNAAFNPLNIQAGDFAHVGTSGSGQYDFADLNDGVAQTVAFLRQGFYVDIVAALTGDLGCAAVLGAVEASPWAEGHYGGTLHDNCPTVAADRARYAAGLIAGIDNTSPPAPAGPTNQEVDAMTADELRAVLGEWMQEQTGLILRTLIGDVVPGSTDVLGQWMKDQERRIEDAIAKLESHDAPTP